MPSTIEIQRNIMNEEFIDNIARELADLGEEDLSRAAAYLKNLADLDFFNANSAIYSECPEKLENWQASILFQVVCYVESGDERMDDENFLSFNKLVNSEIFLEKLKHSFVTATEELCQLLRCRP